MPSACCVEGVHAVHGAAASTSRLKRVEGCEQADAVVQAVERDAVEGHVRRLAGRCAAGRNGAWRHAEEAAVAGVAPAAIRRSGTSGRRSAAPTGSAGPWQLRHPPSPSPASSRRLLGSACGRSCTG